MFKGDREESWLDHPQMEKSYGEELWLDHLHYGRPGTGKRIIPFVPVLPYVRSLAKEVLVWGSNAILNRSQLTPEKNNLPAEDKGPYGVLFER